jgi:hypothetical protein
MAQHAVGPSIIKVSPLFPDSRSELSIAQQSIEFVSMLSRDPIAHLGNIGGELVLRIKPLLLCQPRLQSANQGSGDFKSRELRQVVSGHEAVTDPLDPRSNGGTEAPLVLLKRRQDACRVTL